MRIWKTVLMCAGLLCAVGSTWGGEAMVPRPKVDPAEKVAPDWQGDLAAKLNRRVSFEFVDTPVQEALAFMQTLTNANFVVDPRAVEKGLTKQAITLRVQDMDLKTAMGWICRMAGLTCEQRDQAVFFTVANEGGATEVKKAGGDDGLGVYRLPQGLPQGVTAEKLKELSAVAAPKARVAYDADLKLLVVACEDARDRGRVEALLKVLGIDTEGTREKKEPGEAQPVPPPEAPQEKAGKEF